jgi:hypothetical protein
MQIVTERLLEALALARDAAKREGVSFENLDDTPVVEPE